MAKIRKNELKKYLQQLSKEELETEVLALFERYQQIQEHYTQDLGSPSDRARLLDGYKDKMRKLFGAYRKPPAMSQVRKIITDYKKINIFALELAQLLLYRIELCLELYNNIGYPPATFHGSVLQCFDELCEWIQQSVLFAEFEPQMELIITNYGKTTNYLGPDLVEIYNRYWPQPFGKTVRYQIPYFYHF